MSSVSIQVAQATLPELLANLKPGEEIVIVDADRPVAKLVGGDAKQIENERPGPGLGKGMITIVSDDDEHLQDFAEYMP